MSNAAQAVRDHLSSDPQARGLVFVSLFMYGAEIAKALDCDFYSTHAPTSDLALERMHQRWIAGEKRVMVCTSAFGAGTDYSHVQLVVHVGTSFNIIDYMQEAGRGGRDRQHAMCILIPTLPIAVEEKRNTYDALVSGGCIRHLITSMTDHTGMYCGDDSQNKLCSHCTAK